MYQLPSLLLPGITLVVSPLISLMLDQLSKLPPEIPGACLNSRQSMREKGRTLRDIKDGRIKVTGGRACMSGLL
jgi:ATP-dependent DNA helicase Q4